MQHPTATRPRSGPVYGRRRRALRLALAAAIVTLLPGASMPVVAQPGAAADGAIIDARDAARRRDRARLAADRAVAIVANHPLALWADYWELANRLGEVQQAEVSAFEARWPGSYVEDRLRNDWLLELGRRGDWLNFAAEFPRFRMNDDREVTCYSILVAQQAGKDVRESARAAWAAQRDADTGCATMAAALFDARQLTPADVWRKARFAVDAGKPRAAVQAAGLLGPQVAAAVADLADNPARYLARNASTRDRDASELATLALLRMGSSDPDAAATQLNGRWDKALPADLAAWLWGEIGKQSAIKLQPDAADYFQRADQRSKAGRDLDWPDDTLAWKARAALRADGGRARWQQVVQAITAMAPADQRDAAWVYWKARAMQALAKDSQDADTMRDMSRQLLSSIAGQMNFYGALAAENLGQPVFMPAKPAPLSADERSAAAQRPGLVRALQLIALGLRSEGVREWNFTLRGMTDRELLAAAQLACDNDVWDRCINTSDRTQTEIDIDQRFPTPYRKELTARSGEIALDPAFVYGLIRQESRFVIDARSNVGASGLMQIMPATARWTAKKIGVAYTPDMIANRDTNLRLGTAYLKLVLDQFGGSQALAAAAYNAGPGRPRKWRDGPALEPAVWAENIPFTETRDYVKKVLSNGTYYAALLSGRPPAMAPRLGGAVVPEDPNAPPPDKDLP